MIRNQATWACLPETKRGFTLKLDINRDATKFLYTNNRCVVIRDLQNPELAEIYTEHSYNATVARFSPSGNYVASGDDRGYVRIWDALQSTHILKYDYQPISGNITDLAWDFESKRMIAVGNGRTKFGHAFMIDTGSSVGEIVGHNKVINSIAMNSTRPFRAITCSDDMTVNYFEGVPFKFVKSATDHTKFVTAVAFSPNSLVYTSAGLDGKVFLSDGKTGNSIKRLQAHGESSGIYAMSWSPDSTQLLLSSADGSVKLINMETDQIVKCWNFGDDVTSQQVGNVWRGDFLLTASLSGCLHYLDPRVDNVVKTINGHQKTITALTCDKNARQVYTGSYDGSLLQWKLNELESTPIAKNSKSALISDLALTSKHNQLQSVTHNDSCDIYCLEKLQVERKDALSGQPMGFVLLSNDTRLVCTTKGLIALSSDGTSNDISLDFQTELIAISNDKSLVAVAGENIVKLYQVQDNQINWLASIQQIECTRAKISCIAISPDNSLIAMGDSNSKINVFDISSGTLKINQWVFHTAKVTDICWSPSGKFLVSGSLDTSIIIWSVDSPMKRITMRSAHLDCITRVAFIDEKTIVSGGADSCIKVWKIE